MLILTRKTGESIIINDDIKITVTKINSRQIKIGIQAPKDVKVNREEINDIQNEEKPNKTLWYASENNAPKLEPLRYWIDPRN